MILGGMIRVGQNQDIGVGQFLADAPADFHPIENIEIDIENDEVGSQTPNHFGGGHSVGGFANNFDDFRDDSLQAEADKLVPLT
jgi:hypothetical protein